MKFIKLFLLLLSIAILFCNKIFADVPQTLAFQGRITDNAGVPITETGNFEFQFNDGTNSPVSVNITAIITNGLYSINIDLSPVLGILNFDNQINVTVIYNGNNLGITPLTASPYALCIKDGIVTANKIQDNAVTTAKIASNAVTNVKIADGTITASKIQGGGLPIADGAVTTDKIANSAVTSEKIAGDAITNEKIANNSINGIKIMNNLGGTAYNIYVTSAVYAESAGSGGADLAEIYASSEILEPGDVVVISQTEDDKIEKSKIANDTRVAGVISTEPGMVLNSKEKGYKLALVGKVPVKVTNEGGIINRGDILSVSSTPGYAMKTVNAKSGAIIGKALQNFYGTRGTILVLVNLQ
ncbi:MAG: hypothetical protein LBT18_02655 [Endomicrobium sp.]|jgi:hypothetical protein|nr:hypothetical protein [Endomicrobium sp.]